MSTAVVWDRHGTPTALPPLAGDTGSEARAINDRGQVVGESLRSGVSTAVVWDRHGTATALPPLAGDFVSAARAINRRGDVAGNSFGDLGTAVVWRCTQEDREHSRHDRRGRFGSRDVNPCFDGDDDDDDDRD